MPFSIKLIFFVWRKSLILHNQITILPVSSWTFEVIKNNVMQRHHAKLSYGPRHEKTCLQGFGNNKGADQPAHMRSLISAFIIHSFESIISRFASGEISIF